MSYAPSDEVRALLDRMRPILVDQVMPLEARLLSPGVELADLSAEMAEIRAHVREQGLLTPQMGAEWGGLGLSNLEYAHIAELLGRSPIGLLAFNAQAPDAGNMELMNHFGTPEQQEQWLRPLVEGRIRSCFTMTEPEHAGSNPTMMSTTAVRDGDDWVINGHKWFASSADGADLAIAMVVTDPDAERHQRASMILVPTATPGFRIVRNLPVMGEEGSGWASHAEVVYEDCRVPAANLIGGVGMGFAIAQARLGPGRIHHCMRWIGICERAFELMCRYAATRELAPGKLLGSKQTVQTWIAESRAEIDAARLMVLDTARQIDEVGARQARIRISVIKFFVADILGKVLDRALQCHGGLGMLDDTPIAWFWRHERAARIYDGADEVHKSLVARLVLREHGVRV